MKTNTLWEESVINWGFVSRTFVKNDKVILYKRVWYLLVTFRAFAFVEKSMLWLSFFNKFDQTFFLELISVGTPHLRSNVPCNLTSYGQTFQLALIKCQMGFHWSHVLNNYDQTFQTPSIKRSKCSIQDSLTIYLTLNYFEQPSRLACLEGLHLIDSSRNDWNLWPQVTLTKQTTY